MKIAHLDLECSNLNADWGVIICGCIKWDNGKSKGKLESFRMTDYDQKDMMDDSGVCMAMRDALDTADMWVSWYGAKFDIPYLQARLLNHGEKTASTLTPHVDLWRTSRYQLKVSSNRLANVQRFFKLKASKTPIDQGVWFKAIAGHSPSMNEVVKHCKEDVKMLEEMYHIFLPLIKGHPNIELFKEKPVDDPTCPKCGSSHLWRHGYKVTKTRKYQKWHCQNCGSVSSNRSSEGVAAPPLTA